MTLIAFTLLGMGVAFPPDWGQFVLALNRGPGYDRPIVDQTGLAGNYSLGYALDMGPGAVSLGGGAWSNALPAPNQ